MSQEKFLDLLGATNLIPGPNSTEMAIHVGYDRGGWAGFVDRRDMLHCPGHRNRHGHSLGLRPLRPVARSRRHPVRGKARGPGDYFPGLLGTGPYGVKTTFLGGIALTGDHC